MRLVGTADGGAEILSPPFTYPLRVCLGCLVEFPDGSDSGSVPGPDCCAGAPTSRACLPGQDDPIDCRSCVMSAPEVCNSEVRLRA
jgi:hypothetical protein